MISGPMGGGMAGNGGMAGMGGTTPRMTDMSGFGAGNPGMNGFFSAGSPGMSGLASLLGGMFGNSGAPYQDASNTLNQYAQQAQGYQNPFYNAGVGAINPYQHMLQGMSNPKDFYNNIMGGYSQSPGAQYQQQQGMRAAQNMGSASGLSGSTPLMQQAQQNAQGISSQDQQQYFNNIMGINQGAMNGYQNLMQGGQGAANNLTNMYSNLGNSQAQMAYNQGQGSNNDFMSMLSGGMQMLPYLMM